MFDQLTRREKEVLALVAQGNRNLQIARNLCITEHTVEGHLKNIFRKLRIRSRTAAVKYYWQTQQADISEY
jgi:DNA-binding CsgD family transcriptional regulator